MKYKNDVSTKVNSSRYKRFKKRKRLTLEEQYPDLVARIFAKLQAEDEI